MMAALKHGLYREVSRLCEASPGSRGPRAGLRVLLYHAVGTALPEDPYGIAMAEADFKDHARLIGSLRGEREIVPFGKAPDEKPRLAITFDDGFKDTLRTAAPALVALGLPFTVFVTADYVREPGRLYLDAGELKELAGLPGVTVGAHGNRHVPLTSLGDQDLRSELSDSRRLLEDLIGRPVTAMSYPNGAVDRRVRDAAQAAGFTLAGCSRYGANLPGRDPLLLCRTEVTAWDTVQDLALKIDGHWDWFRFRRADPALS